MENQKKQLYQIVKYIRWNYAISWGLLVAVIGLGIIFNLQCILSGNSLFLDIVRVVYCWMPTIVLVVLHKKLNLNMTIKEFYVEEFRRKIRFDVLVSILLLQILISVSAGIISSIIEGVAMADTFCVPKEGIAASVLFCLITGATGEEAGWRGFLLKGYRQRYNLLTSCIFTGVVWAFWHLPLWILSGYNGVELLIYVIEFIMSLIGFTIVMAYFYDKNPNILVCVFFHYMINFLLSFYCGNDILYQGFTACLYAAVSVLFIVRNKMLYLNHI